MLQTFDIQCKEPAKNWLFDGQYGVSGLSKLQFALWEFAANHNHYWSMFINGLELPFEFNPDLTTIFDDIPDVLEALLQDGKEAIELYFFEQGTNLSLRFRRDGEKIFVEFKDVETSGKRFRQLPTEPQAISAFDFHSAWFLFLDKLLKTLIQRNPRLAYERSYLDYIYRVDKIKGKILSESSESKDK